MRWLLLTALLILSPVPSGWAANPDGVAVIIGNKTYHGRIPAVDYAHNDAAGIKRYVVDVLGYREGNIIDLRDATKAQMEAAFGNRETHKGKLWRYLNPKGTSDIVVFYSGHGVPGQNDRRGYLLPVNADPDQAEINGYPVDLLYRNLGKLKARSKTVLLDACFSGESPKGMLIRLASPVFIQAKAPEFDTNMTILTAASGSQLASWDEKARHGLFTEYLLRGLYGEADNDKNGSVTMAEVKAFLDTSMTRAARRTFGREQTATALGNGKRVLASYSPGKPPVRPKIKVAKEAPRPAPGPNAAEMAFWDAIKGSANPADFEDYMSRFPNGTFVGLAKRRLAALTPATPTGPSLDMIREAQKRLKDLGYDPGTADGRMGAKTQSAIQSFQRSHDLTVDGTVTDALVASLKVARKQVAAVRPAPVPKPAPSPAKPAVGVYPKAYKPGDVFKDCPDCPEMVVVPAGSFTMGSPEDETSREGVPDKYAKWERPLHRVTIPRPFAVGKFEVTRGEFDAFVRTTRHDTSGGCWVWNAAEGKWANQASKSWRDPGYRQTDRDPVVCVSWDDAKAYVAWLSRKAEKSYRLLTEAEWEYATRAGTTTVRFWGESAASACGYANVHDRTSKSANKGFKWAHHDCDDGHGQTAPVGSFQPNGFGLHDMLGNVWEWTEDCWHDSYSGAPTDGSAWTSGGCGRRVLRGGSWDLKPWVVRSAFRSGSLADDRDGSFGFRVARTF
jgi:formylglycine-generating enzyme required for sulfatase activity